ncbi:hypothetical protein H257_16667 [Aphanomyces astaci]|uniref:Uncharacterized protein n=1 Tax=Aphanomyces astaci TaxID=112090 RepID=W4FI29_APHAT|nr:hypothetical protein H257_16667 [Aphanomyces astaci]ETV67125.1 hypothetical protein H257_16667 [Aphanomyces astaci]|eukprot:XP_009843494.1 hypothetical protein H257_16667 [Aphanomyces astaci]
MGGIEKLSLRGCHAHPVGDQLVELGLTPNQLENPTHAFSIQLMEHTIAFRSKGVAYQSIFDVFLGNFSTNIKDVAYRQFIDASRQFAAVPYLLRHGEFVVKADEPFPKPVCPACTGDGATSAGPIIPV